MTQKLEEAAITTTIAEYSETEKQLGLLREKLKDAKYEVTTTAGMELAKKDRREIVTLRTTLEAKRKEIKAPALERCKQIDDEAKRITGELLALETPIDEQIKAEEKRKEEIKKEKEEKERQRILNITERIAGIKNAVVILRDLPTSGEMLLDYTTFRDHKAPMAEDFAEYFPQAQMAYLEALALMEEIITAKQQAEQEEIRKEEERKKEEERLAAEREQLRLEREELERQERERKERQEKEDAERRQKQEQEDAERRERIRLEDEARDRQRREMEAEQNRIKAEREEQERLKREEQEREEKERLERDRLAREEQERIEAEDRQKQQEQAQREFEEKVKAPYAALEAIKEICENKDLSIVALRNQVVAVCDIALKGKV